MTAPATAITQFRLQLHRLLSDSSPEYSQFQMKLYTPCLNQHTQKVCVPPRISKQLHSNRQQHKSTQHTVQQCRDDTLTTIPTPAAANHAAASLAVVVSTPALQRNPTDRQHLAHIRSPTQDTPATLTRYCCYRHTQAAAAATINLQRHPTEEENPVYTPPIRAHCTHTTAQSHSRRVQSLLQLHCCLPGYTSKSSAPLLLLLLRRPV
jgi:hypothetical protein